VCYCSHNESRRAALAFTSQYITDFDAAKAASNNADSLVAAVQRKHPRLSLPLILTFAANAAFPN
jgi:hypothetical protein